MSESAGKGRYMIATDSISLYMLKLVGFAVEVTCSSRNCGQRSVRRIN